MVLPRTINEALKMALITAHRNAGHCVGDSVALGTVPFYEQYQFAAQHGKCCRNKPRAARKGGGICIIQEC